MFKKFITAICVCGLLAGTGCGIGYGIKYNDLKTEQQQVQDTSGLVQNINELRETIKLLNAEKEKLNLQIATLQNSNADFELQIESLKQIKLANEETIASLNQAKEENEETIASLNLQVVELQNQVDDLENQEIQNQQQIFKLNNQISTLQALSEQLQKTNDINVSTIASLNNQILSLNNQIVDLQLQLGNNGDIVNGLNKRIAELEKSVEYYEQYISNLENESQVVATFEFNGSVYNIQILNKGSKASVINPTSTDYIIFNGWTVDGQSVDLNNYVINTNTKFVADVTYKYDVSFKVDNEYYNTQIVTKNTTPILPENPTKDGYVFDYWTLNGVDQVDPTNIQITANTTFIAHFTQEHLVTFLYEDEIYNTQKVLNGGSPTSPSVENTTYKVFNGWLLNGVITDPTTVKITASITFNASITYKYDVIFKSEDVSVNSQIITQNTYAIKPTDPIHSDSDYVFKGWSLDGSTVVDPTTVLITENTTFIALYELKTYTITYKVYGKGYHSEYTELGTVLVQDTTNSWITVQYTNYSSNPIPVGALTGSLKTTCKAKTPIGNQTLTNKYYIKYPDSSSIFGSSIKEITLANTTFVGFSTTQDKTGLIDPTTWCPTANTTLYLIYE